MGRSFRAKLTVSGEKFTALLSCFRCVLCVCARERERDWERAGVCVIFLVSVLVCKFAFCDRSWMKYIYITRFDENSLPCLSRVHQCSSPRYVVARAAFASLLSPVCCSSCFRQSAFASLLLKLLLPVCFRQTAWLTFAQREQSQFMPFFAWKNADSLDYLTGDTANSFYDLTGNHVTCKAKCLSDGINPFAHTKQVILASHDQCAESGQQQALHDTYLPFSQKAIQQTNFRARLRNTEKSYAFAHVLTISSMAYSLRWKRRQRITAQHIIRQSKEQNFLLISILSCRRATRYHCSTSTCLI